MNRPLNPALPANAFAKVPEASSPTTGPSLDKASLKRTPPKSLERLSMPESFALIEWLKAYKVQPGDSIKGMAVAAASALGNSKINENHVRQRMEEFGLALPTRAPSGNIELVARLAKLESALTLIINEQLRFCRAARVDPAPALAAMAKELDLI
jgi:hypothetical protein